MKINVTSVLLLTGLLSAAGCGLTPKSNSAAPASQQTSSQEGVPLKKLSPELAAKACMATASQLEEKGRHQDAIAQYVRARNHQPNHPGVAHRLAVLHDRLGHTDEAWKEYQTAIKETTHSADLFNDLGYFHFQRQQFADAEAAYRKAVETNPGHQRSWTNLGLTLGAQQRFDEALKAFQKAGSPASAQHNLGIVLAQSGEFDKARDAFRKAKQLDPMLKQPEAVLYWLNDNLEAVDSARVMVIPAL